MATSQGHGRWGQRALMLVAAMVLLLVPIAAVAATSLFDDVPDDNIFVEDINWLKTSETSVGCNTAGTNYCPEDYVSRQQMAGFLHRLAVNQVVDAGTVQGFTAAELMGAGGTQVQVFQKSEPEYFGANGLPLGQAAALVTLTFDAPAAGTVTLTSSVTAESPGIGSGGLMWLQPSGTCAYSADINGQQGLWTTKYSSTGATPVTVSMTYVTPVTAGANSFDVCASVQSATADDERAVFRYRNLVGTFVSTP